MCEERKTKFQWAVGLVKESIRYITYATLFFIGVDIVNSTVPWHSLMGAACLGIWLVWVYDKMYDRK